jgi:hypothetical protein
MYDDLGAAQRIWTVVVGAVSLAALGLAALAASRAGAPPAAGWAGWVFYPNALVNLGALGGALAVQYRALRDLRASPDDAAAAWVVRHAGARTLAVLQAGALVAVSAAYLTGEWVNLAFLVPFFGFAAAFFPTRGRLHHWRGGAARRAR